MDSFFMRVLLTEIIIISYIEGCLYTDTEILITIFGCHAFSLWAFGFCLILLFSYKICT